MRDVELPIMHNVQLSPDMVARVKKRRGGKLHAYDRIVVKRRFSALIQGSSDLDARLRANGIDSAIITGTATNICCESTARDAFMLNYRTLVVSDASATVSDEAHNASLNALFTRFADVFSTEELLGLLAPARAEGALQGG